MDIATIQDAVAARGLDLCGAFHPDQSDGVPAPGTQPRPCGPAPTRLVSPPVRSATRSPKGRSRCFHKLAFLRARAES